MIKIHVATGLPTEGGKLEFCAHEVAHRPGASIADYLADLQIATADVSHVVYGGASLSPDKIARIHGVPIEVPEEAGIAFVAVGVEQSDLDVATPADGDEFHVVPKVAGKNAALILGVAGAIIGLATANWALTAKGLQYAMWGYAIGSTLGALIAPRPSNVKDTDDGPTKHTWRGVENEDREGVPVPIVFGKHKTGIVRIAAFIRREFDHEYLHILGLVSVGPVQSISDIRINNQPWENYKRFVLNNGRDITVETRLGGADNATPIRGFTKVATTVDQSTELSVGGTVYSTRPNHPVDALELLFTIPALFHIDERGQQRNNTTRFRYRYRIKGQAYGDWVDVEKTGATRTGRLPTVRIENLTRAEYDVEVAFVSADHTNEDTDAWKVFLTGVTEELDELRTYPGYALVAVRALATQDLSGPIPTISCLCEGLKLERWDGASFLPAVYSDGSEEVGRSPAWIVLRLLRDRSVLNPTYDPSITDPSDPNSRRYSYEAFGLGDWISDDEIDLASFLALANRAKEAVDVIEQYKDGDGAMQTRTRQEPRHLLDIVVNQEMRALDLLKMMLMTCRAHVTWAGNKWRVVTEMPKAPVQLFTMGNIAKTKEGHSTFAITYDADRSINALVPQFIDADRDYEFSTADAIDGPGVTAYGQPRRADSQQFIGITRRSQVMRESMYSLRKRWYLRRFMTFMAGTSAVLCEPGDLINIQHDVPQWGHGGCALPGSSASYVELGKAVELQAGKTYQITVRPQDGSADEGVSRTISDGAGTWQGVNVTTPFPFTVQENDVWWLGEVSPQPATIVAIEEVDEDEDERRIAAIEYNESIENDDAVVVVPILSDLPRFQAPPPPILYASASQTVEARGDGRWVTVITVQWTPPRPEPSYGLYKYANVELSYNGGDNYQPAPNGQGLHDSYRMDDAAQGTEYTFRITPVSTREISNFAGAKEVTITTEGKTTAPPTPEDFISGVTDGVFLFGWSAVAVDDLEREVEYEIRTANPSNWKTDQTGFLWRGKATKFEIDEPAQRTYTLYLKAVDKFGNYSVGAATETITDSAPSAPSIISITRFKNALKVKVSAAPDADVIRLHLHASQTSGFTPSDSTRVAQTLGPQGGEFVFQTSTSGSWFFKVTAEDWLTYALNDWIYSSQSSQSIIIINPVDPTNVVMVVADEAGRGAVVKNPDGSTRPIGLKRTTLTFDFTDAVNPAGSLQGFDMIVYESTDGVEKPIGQHLITNIAQRAHSFINLDTKEGSSYIGAVKAVYIDGLTSNLVTSSGQTIPLETNPNFRSSDDRNVTGLAESFDGGGMPTGFALTTGTLFGGGVGSGSINIQTVAGGAALQWTLSTWVAAYLDRSYSFNNPFALIRMQITPNGAAGSAKPYVQHGASTFNLDPVFTDGLHHTYRVPMPLITVATASSVISLVFPNTFLASGSTIQITAIAIAIESIDQSLDGFMDRAQRARDQFDKGSGGGFFLESPLRTGDTAGNITLIDENGLVWLRADGFPEASYKRGRQAIIRNVTDAAAGGWDTTVVGGGGIDPSLPAPVGINKTRFILRPSDPTTQEGAPMATPVRRYSEVVRVDDLVYVMVAGILYGGTPGTYRADAGAGWASSVSQKSAITESGITGGSFAGDNDDAWYDFSGRGIPASVAAYRVVGYVSITMPLMQKANNSFYRTKIRLHAWYGRPLGGSPNTNNPPTFINELATHQWWPITISLLTDGKTIRVPIVDGGSQISDPNARMFMVRWEDSVVEAAAGAASKPSAVKLDAVEVYYVNGATYVSAANQNFDLTYVEEF